ncbi:S26 family signal peptidase [Sphingomonas sp. OTU376]|uniref:S26 family signal peptidase n=1 Tax=Sphingomonas sp. OTU376 TaxID=3043863 RepID=UPI00313B9D11
MAPIALGIAGICAVLVPAIGRFAPKPRLLWNASASAPIGLYRVHPGAMLRAGDLVAISPPPLLARMMVERHYLALGVPLLKHVAALPGQIVCRSGGAVTIAGRLVALARPFDSHARILPFWQGCRRIREGELFLLNPTADSFDSRYFGPVPAAGLIGRATPLLTRDTPGAALCWRAGGQSRALRSTSQP